LGGQKNGYAGLGKENKATGSGREIWQFNVTWWAGGAFWARLKTRKQF
jgi:hypothetical protein